MGLDGQQRERTVTVDTLAEAKKLRADGRAQLRPDGATTLNAWHDRYWPTIEDGIRPATARAYGVSWRKRVQPWFGHRKLESISVGDVEEAIAGWSGVASTRIDALSVLSRLLDGAVRAGILSGNPARAARRPRQDSPQSLRSRALTADEVLTMLAIVPDGPYRRYLAGLAYTGMRAEEGSALRVGDVDLRAGMIHVRRSFSPGKSGELIEQTPKSHKERTVPLPAALRPYLSRRWKGRSVGTWCSPVLVADGSA